VTDGGKASAPSAGRARLRADALREALPGGLWSSFAVVASTGSTNADLLARGGPEGQVLLAEEQTAGRGRMGRSWVSVPGDSLTFSVLLRPSSVPPAQRGWLPLLTGVAVAAAVRSAAGVHATLKWPNDVLAGERKLAGILAEQSPDGSAVVVGVGLNAGTREGALPVSPTGLPATSLLAEGADVNRERVLIEILRQVERWYLAFRSDPDPVRTGLLAEYRSLCGTLGRAVRVELPAGRVLAGTATGIDPSGHLEVTEPGSVRPANVAAGDVIHLRLVPPGHRIRPGRVSLRWRRR
jgi:BirA family biotin operon repressor/biotin-[acetyl-CoA-carboxylase] ligase